jgi:hypothetical protein
MTQAEFTSDDHRGGGRLSSIHQEAICRFLRKLDACAVSALGIPPELSVSGSYLVVIIPSEAHTRALLLSSDIFIKAASGLFDGIRFVWDGGKWCCPLSVPQPEEKQ